MKSKIPGTLMNNKGLVIVVRALLALTTIIFICCGQRYNSHKDVFNEIKQVKLLLSFPTVTVKNQLITIKDSQYITYYKDLVLYKFPYSKEFSRSLTDSSRDITKRKIIRVQNDFQVLVYRKGEQYGYYFDSLQDQKGARMNVDSLVSKRFSIVEKFLYNPNDSLIRSISEPESTIHEVYIRKQKNDKWDCDTSHLFFSDDLNDVDFSFSKKLDSLKKLKLFKIYQVSNGDPKNADFFFTQKREVFLELKGVPIDSTKEIVDFWKRVQEN